MRAESMVLEVEEKDFVHRSAVWLVVTIEHLRGSFGYTCVYMIYSRASKCSWLVRGTWSIRKRVPKIIFSLNLASIWLSWRESRSMIWKSMGIRLAERTLLLHVSDPSAHYTFNYTQQHNDLINTIQASQFIILKSYAHSSADSQSWNHLLDFLCLTVTVFIASIHYMLDKQLVFTECPEQRQVYSTTWTLKSSVEANFSQHIHKTNSPLHAHGLKFKEITNPAIEILPNKSLPIPLNQPSPTLTTPAQPSHLASRTAAPEYPMVLSTHKHKHKRETTRPIGTVLNRYKYPGYSSGAAASPNACKLRARPSRGSSAAMWHHWKKNRVQ